jgi:hypothetical protein
MRKFASVAVAVIVLLTAWVAVERRPAAAAGAANPRAMEREFVQRLNDERAANGKAPLTRDPGLDTVALDWSGRMAATFDRTGTVLAAEPNRSDCSRSALCHRPDLGPAIEAVERAWRSGGENVGTGYDVAGLHDAFVASSGHFANIVGNWNRVGMGVVVQPDGRIWVTVNFLLGPPLAGAPAPVPTGAQRWTGAPVPEEIVTAGPARLAPAAPTRVVDTRIGLGAVRLTAGRITSVSLARVPGRPLDASGAVLNITAVQPSGAGHLTVFPCGRPTPLASNLNFGAGQVVANLANAALGPDATVCLFASSATDVVIDLNGWFRAGADGARLTAASPIRVFDSRSSAGRGREFRVSFVAHVPTGTTAVTLNATVTGTAAAGHLTAYPCGTEPPLASNLNYVTGQTVANQITVRTGTDASVCFRSFADTDLVVDLAGWFAGTGGDVIPVVPTRFLDTRSGAGGWKGTLAATQSIDVAIADIAGVPASATAAVVNLTVTGTTGAGYVTLFPCGTVAPTTSSVNFVVGQTVANLATVRLGEGGRLCAYASAGTDIVVDLAGYVQAGG